ncbi:hypothetical protein GA0115246_106701 [Streptomyces sp. SolWspMP-sol7th]|nr:hypothetical protein GA0115246_106701 [Streptomyces sp. SolWspMP-sol7th]
MFSVSSWSPPEIHILLPKRRYVPSPACSARVRTSASEEPACGSERHIVPNQRPSAMGRTKVSICSRLPWASRRFALPMVRKGYADVPTFAAWNHAKHASVTTRGSCIPPTEASSPALVSPASAKTFSASPTSGMTCTRSPSKVGSCASPSLLWGAKWRAARVSLSSSTASNVARSCSA